MPIPRTKSPARDPLEVALEGSLQPGRFIEESEEWEFVTSLDAATKAIEGLVGTDAPRAVRLYEAFLAGCYEKAEEGQWEWSFGNFVQSLWCDWLRARQAADTDADETARRLLARMEDDPYCLAYGMTAEAVKVMGREQLAAFERATREWFAEQAGDTTVQARTADPERARWRRDEILRHILVQRGDVDAYIALCEDFEVTSEDCLVVAKMYRSRGTPAEALGWVERGLTMIAKWKVRGADGSGLVKLRRELLVELGRGDEALAGVWREYCEHPSHFRYGELMKFVPTNERDHWHRKAIEIAAERADLGSALELWLATREYGMLVECVRGANDAELEDLGHDLNDRVAAYLDQPYPALAARVYRALGMRVLVARKSRYYDAALRNFADARRCYVAAGLEGPWNALVLAVRGVHSRKSGFMAGFERVVAGESLRVESSFLERARSRWFTEEPR